MKSKVAVIPCEEYEELKVYEAVKKPVILKNKCIRCGACITACPLVEKALSFPETQGSTSLRIAEKSVPVYDYKKCIRCYCC